MTRAWKRAGIGLLAIPVLIQLWPVKRTNPPVTGELAAPSDVAAILHRACYDCHSNQTRWPWYAYVAPVSWLVTHDVEKGRNNLNFSEWSSMSARRRSRAPEKMIDNIEKGEMPLPIYLRMHREAKLSPEDVETIRGWADWQSSLAATD